MRTPAMPIALMLLATLGCEPRSSGEVADQSDTTATPAIDATSTGNVVATLTEWEIALSTDTVPAGHVTFQIMNRGTEYHRFEIEGAGIEWVSDSLQGNGELSAQVQLSPGTYEVYCPILGSHGVHKELGMVDTLTVR
jgi:plastocyanin